MPDINDLYKILYENLNSHNSRGIEFNKSGTVTAATPITLYEFSVPQNRILIIYQIQFLYVSGGANYNGIQAKIDNEILTKTENIDSYYITDDPQDYQNIYRIINAGQKLSVTLNPDPLLAGSIFRIRVRGILKDSL